MLVCRAGRIQLKPPGSDERDGHAGPGGSGRLPQLCGCWRGCWVIRAARLGPASSGLQAAAIVAQGSAPVSLAAPDAGSVLSESSGSCDSFLRTHGDGEEGSSEESDEPLVRSDEEAVQADLSLIGAQGGAG